METLDWLKSLFGDNEFRIRVIASSKPTSGGKSVRVFSSQSILDFHLLRILQKKMVIGSILNKTNFFSIF
jgi:hypothetical protein